MRRLILLIAILFSFSFKVRRDTTQLFNDRLEILKGKVKQLIEIDHNHTAEWEYPLTEIITTTFDRQGNIVSKQIKDVFAKKLEEVKYLYKLDPKGEKVQTIVRSYGSTTIYKYGRDGNINEQQLYFGKRLRANEFYKYDNTGNLIGVEPEKGDYFLKFKYKYDNSNKVIEEYIQGIKTIDQYKSFDTKGNWLQMIRTEHVIRFPGKNAVYPSDTITRKITYY